MNGKNINIFFNIGLPGRDGTPGLPGSKGFGKYPYHRERQISIFNLLF
jgi:hypothetical protein